MARRWRWQWPRTSWVEPPSALTACTSAPHTHTVSREVDCPWKRRGWLLSPASYLLSLLLFSLFTLLRYAVASF
ncbi:hypothetical protein TRSC58_07708 [Trypanosoma rangeli SC58]|uniref:Uncharacterized protein n=1 Tax=Trypanosoma rangeli SC58 TaxID=429131 RepID=A0A061ISN3_TRYRA|nr:hypothetical protein TRSC58_07708 [Trypanosoma rangeli SC58]